jgi:hypothetical protein
MIEPILKLEASFKKEKKRNNNDCVIDQNAL